MRLLLSKSKKTLGGAKTSLALPYLSPSLSVIWSPFGATQSTVLPALALASASSPGRVVLKRPRYLPGPLVPLEGLDSLPSSSPERSP